MTVGDLLKALARHRGAEHVEVVEGAVYVHGESVSPVDAESGNCPVCKSE